MLYTLENETAVLCVDTYACEIRSFRRKDKEIEYMLSLIQESIENEVEG